MSPPTLADLLEKIDPRGSISRLLSVGPTPDGHYFHWDELRHRTPPEGLSTEEWWAGVKLARTQQMKTVPLRDRRGESFRYWLPDPVLRLLHEVDREASGRIEMEEEVTNPATRDRYIINSLIEESITSSQLEGASTTTDVAKEMIRSGRKPVDTSERMILNNYHAMRFVQQNVGAPLTPEWLFALHRIVTADTLHDATRAGRLRTDADRIVVEDGQGNVLHVPPAAAELEERVEALCAFANDRPDDAFVHPVIRAIILHFWIGYDHPFVDGNGRTARAIFYWSMLSQGYWLTEYISISRILKGALAQYGRSFLHTETDANDLTYFILYQLSVIRRAIDGLQGYLRKKIAEVRQVEALLQQSGDLNHRQLAVLGRALKHPGTRSTIRSHQRSHNVTYQTARTDLLDLAERGLLIQRKRGRTYFFHAPDDLGRRLQEGEVTSSSTSDRPGG